VNLFVIFNLCDMLDAKHSYIINFVNHIMLLITLRMH